MILFSAQTARRARGGRAALCRVPRGRAPAGALSRLRRAGHAAGPLRDAGAASLPAAPPADARAGRRSGARAPGLGELRRRHGRGLPRDGRRRPGGAEADEDALPLLRGADHCLSRGAAGRARARSRRRLRATSFPMAPQDERAVRARRVPARGDVERCAPPTLQRSAAARYRFPELDASQGGGAGDERRAVLASPCSSRDIPAGGKHFRVEADDGERQPLAEALGIVEVARADGRARRPPGSARRLRACAAR